MWGSPPWILFCATLGESSFYLLIIENGMVVVESLPYNIVIPNLTFINIILFFFV